MAGGGARAGRVLATCAEWGLIAFALQWAHRRFIAEAERPLLETIGWDIDVYHAAASVIAAGRDPYDPAILHAAGVDPSLHFTSPPLVGWLLGLAGEVAPMAVWPATALLIVVSFFAVALVMGRLFLPDTAQNWVIALGASLAAFQCAGIIVFAAGNMGTILYLPIIAALGPGLLHKRWALFHVAVAAASAFKPFYAAFWLLPLFAHGWSWRAAFGAGAGFLAATATYLLPAFLSPHTFAQWLDQLRRQTLELQDLGESAFNAAATSGGWMAEGAAPYLIHILFSATLVGMAGAIAKPGARWAALTAAAVLINPRMMKYDEVIAAIPLVALCLNLLPQGMGRRGALVLAAWIVAAFSYLGDRDDVVTAWVFAVLGLVLIGANVARDRFGHDKDRVIKAPDAAPA